MHYVHVHPFSLVRLYASIEPVIFLYIYPFIHSPIGRSVVQMYYVYKSTAIKLIVFRIPRGKESLCLSRLAKQAAYRKMFQIKIVHLDEFHVPYIALFTCTMSFLLSFMNSARTLYKVVFIGQF